MNDGELTDAQLDVVLARAQADLLSQVERHIDREALLAQILRTPYALPDIRWEKKPGAPPRYLYGRVGVIWAFTINSSGRGPILHPKLPGPLGERGHEGPFVTMQAAQARAREILAEFIAQLIEEG
ncbi:hypothetical protein ACFLIM_09100 [Nonomuraea sp. M3C6]|uniref:Bacteriophage HK97-gp10, tail-component n=1 Tax=Nonomuraea marmarensis TaxID=3351344 RepID=A0ABW7A7P3_9ACTN